jgi:hypothetical protein
MLGAAIGDLRRRLMAEHLGVKPLVSGEVPAANWVQLNDGRLRLPRSSSFSIRAEPG